MFTVFPKGLLSVLMFLSKSVFFEYQFQVSVCLQFLTMLHCSKQVSFFQLGCMICAKLARQLKVVALHIQCMSLID
jgi:uncharacterized membrane protein